MSNDKHQELDYKIIFNNYPHGIFYFDNKGVITDCNNKFLETINSTKEIMVGFNTLKKLQNKNVIAEIKRCLKTGSGYYEGPYISVTGKKEIISRGTFIAIKNNNKIIGGFCVLEDITAQFEQENILVDLNNEYATLNEAYLEQNEELLQINTEIKDTNKILTKEKEKNLELIENLSKAEENYKTIFNNVATPMMIHQDGIIVLINDAVLKFAEITDASLIIGKPTLHFIHEDSKEEALKAFNKIVQGGSSYFVERKVTTPKGKIKTVILNAIMGVYNKKPSLIISFTDITDLKNSKRTLEEINFNLNNKNALLEEETAKNEEVLEKLEVTEKNYRTLFNNVATPMMIHQKGVIVLINDAVLKFAEITDASLIVGKSSFYFTHKDSIEDSKKAFAKIMQGGSSYFVERKLVIPNGKEKDVIMNAIMGVYNNEPSLIISFTDITEIKESKNKLEEINLNLNNKNALLEEETTKNEEILERLAVTEKNYRTLFNSSPVPMSVHSKGRIILVNEAAKSFLEIPNDINFIGEPIFQFIHESSKEAAAQNIARLLREGKTDIIEEKFITYTGKIKDVLLNSTQFSYDGKDVILAAFADITEIKESKQRLEKLNAEFKQQNTELIEETAKNEEILEKLGIAEQNYRAIIDSSPIPIIVHLDGKLVYVNDEAIKFIKVKNKEAILDKPILDYIHPDYHEFVIKNVEKVIAGEKGELVEEVFITSDGEPRTVLLKTGQFIYNNQKAVIVGFVDITEMRTAENKLRLLSKGVDSSPASIVVTSKKGIIEFVNNKFTEITGFTQEEALGLNPRVLKSGHHDVKFYKKLWGTISKGNDWRGDICNRKKNGDIFWEYAIISPIFDDNKKITHYIAIKEDITRRKEIEQKLVKNERYFKTLFETAPDGIFEIDKTGVITNCNKEFANSVFTSKENIIGTKASLYITSKEKYSKLFTELIKKGSIESELVQKNTNGTTTFVWRKVSAIYNKKGEFTGALVYNRDISKIKETEKLLINAKNKAEESDKLKTAFLSNMSHEIRTPLNAIIGFSKIISKDNIEKTEKNKFTDYINHNSKLLLNLINDIIDISKIEANQLTINKHKFELNELFTELELIYTAQIKEINKDIKLILDIPNNIIHINSDELRLKQVLINLMSNALKFTKTGSIILGFNIKNNKLNLFVKDTGIGIPKDKLDIVFNRFIRIQNLEYKQKGTGLGLAIVKNIIEMLNGTISVKSEVNKGSEFNVEFSDEIVTKSKITKQIPSKTFTKNIDWSNKTVLIAEDDEFNFIVLSELLKECKINIIHAKNGLEAIELYKDNKIDIVLMDIQMPELDGYGATKEILKINPKAKIIAQTAFAMSNEKYSSIDVGCIDFITKPIDITQLLILLTKYI